ncbi:hypothetical protein JCM14720_02890 [Calditerricola yamamurae]
MEHVPPSAVLSWKLVMALVFFSLTYLVIITEFHNRAVAALAGATGIVLTGVLPLEEADERDVETAFHSVEWVSIFFFVGLFVLVGSLQHVGVIKWLATQALVVTGHDIERAAYLILWLSGVVSAFVDNIPFVGTMIPLIQDLGHGMDYALQDKALEPLCWALALGACLGGNGTLIGASAMWLLPGWRRGKASRLPFGVTWRSALRLPLLPSLYPTFTCGCATFS